MDEKVVLEILSLLLKASPTSIMHRNSKEGTLPLHYAVVNDSALVNKTLDQYGLQAMRGIYQPITHVRGAKLIR